MSDFAMSLCLSVAFLIGVYAGVFIREAVDIYSCEKDGTVIIKGEFWKGEMAYSCTKRAIAKEKAK